MKIAEEAISGGVYFCRLMKTIHKSFCLPTLEKFMKDFPVGSYIVLKSNTIVPCDILFMAIGYKYNYRNVL